MIKAEFGIIDAVETDKGYSEYEPSKYHCVAIDDEYLYDWWNQLQSLRTYFHSLDRPSFALARWGVTLIPPESLPMFREIVSNDKRMDKDSDLVVLVGTIDQAIKGHKYMIHYGV